MVKRIIALFIFLKFILDVYNVLADCFIRNCHTIDDPALLVVKFIVALLCLYIVVKG